MDQSKEAVSRCVIKLECPDCDEADVTSVLEHPPDSVQAEAVHEATLQVAEEHRGETDHDPTVTKEGKRNR